MPVRVRLVVTAGPLDGRGHLGRALSLAEALAERGAAAELQLLDGSLGPNEAARAAAASLAVVGSDEAIPPRAAVVVDLPDPGAAPAVDPDRLLVIDDRDSFAGRAAVIVQPSQTEWRGPGSAGTVLAGYDYVPISAAVRRRRAAALGAGAPAVGRRVVVCFGGADPGDVTGRLVRALAGLDAEVEVIVGPSYRGSTAGWPVEAVRDPADLVDRLAHADLVRPGRWDDEVRCRLPGSTGHPAGGRRRSAPGRAGLRGQRARRGSSATAGRSSPRRWPAQSGNSSPTGSAVRSSAVGRPRSSMARAPDGSPPPWSASPTDD